ncbi:hypothetical protein RND81_02G100500 [Saponaria officinalis]|uniref:Uncharacterized protein n=1 Tax=Saponaria officinalis TaxID=3572 RepID=A0AAW1MRU8_SAPOF
MAGNPSPNSNLNPNPIKTVVVLVMENRSFDHILGWMKQLHPELDGVSGSNEFSNPFNTSDPDSTRMHFGDGSVYVDPNPGHEFQDIYEQIYGEPWSEDSKQKKSHPTMQGFAQNANRIQPRMAETVMNGFKPELVPVYKELVTEFGVCDRWFASAPAATHPNRLYIHSATSHGLTTNDNKKLYQGLPQKTIFDSLHESGFSFGIYYKSAPSTLYYRNLRKLKYLTKFHQFDLKFKHHCKEGKLPNYVVIEPNYFDLPESPGDDDHPSHDVSRGQKFVKEIYEALRSSPQWNEMLFLIIYDEHGGFFDHVPTPVDGVPSPDGRPGPAPYSFGFDRLGVRVPAIFISPWIEPKTVIHSPTGPEATSQYEHSSIPETIKKLFHLKSFLTNRDAWAGTFESVLNRTTPRTDCPVTLPEPVTLRDINANQHNQLSDFQEDLVQLAACLRGEHTKDDYPGKLLEGMTVGNAAKYCNNTFTILLEECEKSRQNGVDDDSVVVAQSSEQDAVNKDVEIMRLFHNSLSTMNLPNHS